MNRIVATVVLTLAISACGGGDGAPHEQASTASDALPSSPPETPEVESSESAFQFEQASDPMSDEDRSFVYTPDVTEGSGALRRAAAIWRCKGPELESVISAADFLTTSEPVSVQWRLDDQPPAEPDRWPVSTEGTAVFASDLLRVALTEGALGAHRLRVRLTDYQGTYHDYEFDLAGLDAALRKLGCSLDPARRRIEAARQARAAQAAAAERRAESARIASERAAAFAREWPFVGSANTKAYMPTASDCWRAWVDSASAPFFKSEDEAKAKGYTPSNICR